MQKNKQVITDKLEGIGCKLEMLDATNNFIFKKLLEIQHPQAIAQALTEHDNKEVSDSVKLYFIQNDINDYLTLVNNSKDVLIDIKETIQDILKEI